MRILILFCSMIFLFSCKKEDQILFEIFTDPIEVYEGQGQPNYVLLDLDQDGVNDFMIEVTKPSFAGGGGSGSSGIVASIESLHKKAKFLDVPDEVGITRFELNQIIAKKKSKWETKKDFIKVLVPGDVHGWDSGFIGVCVNNQIGWIEVEIEYFSNDNFFSANNLLIKGIGINLTKGKSIRAGQTQ